MRILIVVPEQDRISGNWVSARRYQQGLSELNHQVRIFSVPLDGTPAFRHNVIDFAPDVALLLHAYRSGRPWLTDVHDLDLPFAVMMTGTDINQGFEDPEQMSLIAECIRKATYVLLQNPLLAQQFSKERPGQADKVRTVKPGVILGKTPYSLRKRHNLDTKTPLFLCPAGIRPIKMQRELLNIFEDVVTHETELQLAFCGPCLDESYSKGFLTDIQQRPWAKYLGAISPNVMASVMNEADVIVNNSLAEGLSNSLVEAATLGLPILARNNPGNAAVVKHHVNGLLYSQPEECKDYIKLFLDPDKRTQLSHSDASYTLKEESSGLEAVLVEAIKLAEKNK